MSLKKGGKDNMQNLYATSFIPQLSGKSNHQNKRRKSVRFVTKGIVVLTGFEEPVVANICDIASEGISFVHADKKNIINFDFKMEVLIYDSQTDFEYFISQISGRGKSVELVSDPTSNLPIWRYGVEFLDINSSQRNRLQACSSLMSYRRFVALQAVVENKKLF